MFPRLSLLAAVLLPFIGGVAPCQAQEKLVLASGAQGNWETAAANWGAVPGFSANMGFRSSSCGRRAAARPSRP